MKNFKNTSKRSSSPSLRRILAGLGVVLLVAGVLALLDARSVIDLPFFKDKKAVSPTNGVNYGPPTEEEKAETEQFKDSLGGTAPTTTPTPAGQKNPVTTVLTSWGPKGQSIEARGSVSVVESGGTCTLTATKGSQSASQSIAATPNAQNVSCGLITIPSSSLTPGSWSITLSYSSTASEGISQAQTVEVP